MTKRCKQKAVSIFIAFLLGASSVLSQEQKKFEVGRPCPAFELHDVENFNNKSFSSKSAKSKWLLLHFFSIGCSASFTSLSKLDSIQRFHGDEVQVIMIGKWDPYTKKRDSALKRQYDEYQRRYKFSMPYAYMNGGVSQKMGIWTAPLSVLVDLTGTVRLLFFVTRPSISDILSFVRGQKNDLLGNADKIFGDDNSATFDFNKLLFLEGNGGKDTFLFRSILSPELNVVSPNPLCINSNYGNRVQFINQTLEQLFMVAFSDTMPLLPGMISNSSSMISNSYGKFYPVPVWEGYKLLPDLSKKYCYSLFVSEKTSSPLLLQHIMQRDLCLNFGAKVRVESRNMPCWKLTSDPDAHRALKSAGGTIKAGGYDFAGIHLRNVPVAVLIGHLWDRYRMEDPIVNLTGIDETIDIDLEVLFTEDISYMIAELKKHGLNLVYGKSNIKVVVINPE